MVAEVRARISASGATILTEYRGLKVAELAELRRAVGQAGGDYRIYKNTLVRFAARELGLDGLVELLQGPTALAFVQGDPVDVAKALRDYARANPVLVIKGGVLGEGALSADQARALADVPPRAVLLARLAGGLAAPLQQFAGLLQALPRNLAYGLKALIDQRSTGEPTPEPMATAPPEAASVPEPEANAPEATSAPEASAETNSPPNLGFGGDSEGED